jgi:hypothetical protein
MANTLAESAGELYEYLDLDLDLTSIEIGGAIPSDWNLRPYLGAPEDIALARAIVHLQEAIKVYTGLPKYRYKMVRSGYTTVEIVPVGG